jgi:hypothetical protein
MSADNIEVTVRFKGDQMTVSGNPDQVIRELLVFFSKVYPQLETVRRISLSVDATELLGACEGVMALTPEGMAITADTGYLREKELIMLHLAKTRVGQMLGKLEGDTLRLNDLVVATKSKSGTVAGRLSEMCSEGIVERSGKGEYRATTSGLDYFIKSVVPKFKLVEK